jgi:hypothetical protein
VWVGDVGVRGRVRQRRWPRDSAALGLQHGSHLGKGDAAPSIGLWIARRPFGFVDPLDAPLELLAFDLGPPGLHGLAGLPPPVADRGHHRAGGVLGVAVRQPGKLAGHLVGIPPRQRLSDAACDTDLGQVVH